MDGSGGARDRTIGVWLDAKKKRASGLVRAPVSLSGLTSGLLAISDDQPASEDSHLAWKRAGVYGRSSLQFTGCDIKAAQAG